MRKLAASLILFLSLRTAAQDTIPVLRGTVRLSILQGTIECNLTMTDIPRIKDYVIRINSGMNIRYFRDLRSRYRLEYDKTPTDSAGTEESCAYFFGEGHGHKWLPDSIQFRYVGMYPVIADTSDEESGDDWRGNISFNGYSLRADGFQACWYPVLYDVARQKTYDKVRYDLQVDCADCSVIYVNGSAPVKGTHAHVASQTPRELMTYMGRFDVVNEGGTYFLNPDLDAAHLKTFGAVTNNVKEYYAAHLGIPYRDTITYIQTTPTEKQHAWLFVSYPSIVNVGWGKYGMKSFADPRTGGSFRVYMAHELGHYYFGTIRRFNTGLGDMMSEGFAEFLSLHAAKNLIADSLYRQGIDLKIKTLQGFTAVPFARVTSTSDYINRELYVYYYAPLIFTAIEREIGEPAAWRWMHELVSAPAEFTDYAFLLSTLRTAVGDSARVDVLKAKYFESDQALGNAIAEIQSH
jgi:hypothetical protein